MPSIVAGHVEPGVLESLNDPQVVVVRVVVPSVLALVDGLTKTLIDSLAVYDEDDETDGDPLSFEDEEGDEDILDVAELEGVEERDTVGREKAEYEALREGETVTDCETEGNGEELRETVGDQVDNIVRDCEAERDLAEVADVVTVAHAVADAVVFTERELVAVEVTVLETEPVEVFEAVELAVPVMFPVPVGEDEDVVVNVSVKVGRGVDVPEAVTVIEKDFIAVEVADGVAEVDAVLNADNDIEGVVSAVPVKIAEILIVNVTTGGVNETIDDAEGDFDTAEEPEGVADVDTLAEIRADRVIVTDAEALFDEIVDEEAVRVNSGDADEEAEPVWERERIGETDVVADNVKLFVGRLEAVGVGVAVVVFEIPILFERVPDAETLFETDDEPVNVNDPRDERDSDGETVFEEETAGVRDVKALTLSV